MQAIPASRARGIWITSILEHVHTSTGGMGTNLFTVCHSVLYVQSPCAVLLIVYCTENMDMFSSLLSCGSFSPSLFNSVQELQGLLVFRDIFLKLVNNSSS